LFFRFDPLIFLTVSVATRAILTLGLLSLSLVIATFLFGRFFCGFACPLGTAIDLLEPLVRRRAGYSGPVLKNVKYLLLLFLAAAAVVGVSRAQFFDPLAIMDRFLTLFLYPVVGYFLAFTALRPMGFVENLIAPGSFVLIVGSSFFASRFWCRNLCPLGALLALISKFSVFKFTFRDDCLKCKACGKVCPTGAIRIRDRLIDSAECVACLRCWAECPNRRVGYRPYLPRVPFDVRKRQFVAALAAGVFFAPLARSLIHVKLIERLIRPPGSLPEPDFMNACLRCGLCMKACPTNGLQPCLTEAGFGGLWTPRLVGRIGGCEKFCNACGRVCPTSAIRDLTLEEKSFAKMGTAVIDRDRCIAWAQDKVCLICDEACQYNAIDSRGETIRGVNLLRPFVKERVCVGCGICEARCPLEGTAAIQVFPTDEERKRTGSYITEEKRRLRDEVNKNEDLPSGFITE
jgi:MauM/NapG family ferredoxin protein